VILKGQTTKRQKSFCCREEYVSVFVEMKSNGSKNITVNIAAISNVLKWNKCVFKEKNILLVLIIQRAN